ncbi:hypothetical protein BA895_20670 [Humibacillus sp. DSM 29435]|uniref:hypothetical protein n=1 Tax=Humibacillus sp. DSM 29435 TaxID=1869167 RepID=UPI000872BC00|nr:hypothetical protein [Humibacillus sp. DSM 29435]OFE16127.1 hypothetical protein BA895_20670 [Humibacillus sp. DSM 29435]
MIFTGAVASLLGATAVFIDMFDRWRSATNVIDGGGPGTDYAAELRKVKRRAALSMGGPIVIAVGAVLTLIGVRF